MKTIIAGGRAYLLTETDEAFLNAEHALGMIGEVVSGGATGADAGGEAWAKKRGVPVTRFPADWVKHGRAAGPLRNRQMAEYAKGGRCILFPGGAGTASMFSEAMRAGLEIIDLRGPAAVHRW